MFNTMDDFIDYVYSFYNTKDGIYPMKGITKRKIAEASLVIPSNVFLSFIPTYELG